MEQIMEKLVIIDGNSLINRAFYALPNMTNSKGQHVNAVYGFCNILTKLVLEEQADYMAICFDAGKHTFRNDIYAEYKGTRKSMPTELAEQLPLLKDLLKQMNIFTIEEKGIEADDLVGSISKKFNIPTVIVSGDRDLLQLIDPKTEVHLTKKGVTDIDIMTTESLKAKWGLEPYQIVELKALMGDSSDNIPGVLGIGEKTAKQLIIDYHNIDNLYDKLDEIKGKTYEKLISGKTSAYMSKTLATINVNVPINASLENLKYDFPFKKQVYQTFQNYEFHSFLNRYDLFELNVKEDLQKKSSIINIKTFDELNKFNDTLSHQKEFAFYMDKNIHISFDYETEYIINYELTYSLLGLSLDGVLQQLKPFLESEEYKKTCLDTKNIKHILANHNINFVGDNFDVSIASYLVNGGKNGSQKIDYYLSNFSFAEDSIACCLNYAKSEYIKKLTKENMIELYYNLEMPLIDVLFDMEQSGFKIDKMVLEQMTSEYKEKMDNLNQEIITLCGTSFNVNSPKQLSEILFNKLMLPKQRKSGTGVDVLESLRGSHPVIEKILEYRKISKLYTTYLVAFEKMLDDKNLIHTIFNQTLTATGRLSSQEPNLQNIPVRTEEGKVLRKMFVSRFENGKIISADYSQIELRILAHFSMEDALIYAYNHGIDIHAKTASDVFGENIDNISYDERRKAKAVNFGIIYGISEFGLSENLKISPKEAKAYIEQYFKTYPKVKAYMDSNVEKAKQNGYAITLLNRRRKIDELSSSIYFTRQFGERVAMNMPLQGSASDIIKLAMIEVHNKLKQLNLKSKLILQIHDELIIDTFDGEEQIIKSVLKDCMENVVKLNVPLVVDINSGDTWFDAK